MTNLEVLKELEISSLQIEVLSDNKGEVVAASTEYWQALRDFDEEYPAISEIIKDYQEEENNKEEKINNSLMRSFVYSGTAAIVGAVCPPLAIASLVGVGLTMFGLLNRNPNK